MSAPQGSDFDGTRQPHVRPSIAPLLKSAANTEVGMWERTRSSLSTSGTRTHDSPLSEIVLGDGLRISLQTETLLEASSLESGLEFEAAADDDEDPCRCLQSASFLPVGRPLSANGQKRRRYSHTRLARCANRSWIRLRSLGSLTPCHWLSSMNFAPMSSRTIQRPDNGEGAFESIHPRLGAPLLM